MFHSVHLECHQRRSFTLKIHQNRWRLGLCPRPHWGSLQRFPRPPSWINGPTSKGKGGEGRGGTGPSQCWRQIDAPALQIYHCVQLNALFCCLWRNVEASCHKHFVAFSGNQHCRLLPAMCHNLRDGGRPPATALTTPACCSVNTSCQASQIMLRIAISAYPTCIRRPR